VHHFWEIVLVFGGFQFSIFFPDSRGTVDDHVGRTVRVEVGVCNRVSELAVLVLSENALDFFDSFLLLHMRLAQSLEYFGFQNL